MAADGGLAAADLAGQQPDAAQFEQMHEARHRFAAALETVRGLAATIRTADLADGTVGGGAGALVTAQAMDLVRAIRADA